MFTILGKNRKKNGQKQGKIEFIKILEKFFRQIFLVYYPFLLIVLLHEVHFF